MDLQEMITRGRFLMAEAPERLKVFELVNGKRTTKEIAEATGRSPSNVAKDIAKLNAAGLIEIRKSQEGQGQVNVYEKAPLARTIPIKYFKGTMASLKPTPAQAVGNTPRSRRARDRRPSALAVPNESETLNICNSGEDSTYEFKAQGADARRIAKEAAAMMHSPQGGMILYGVEDDGTIQGTDLARQSLDQAVQNAIRNNIAPAASVRLHSISVLGTEVIAIIVSPWNRRDVYQFDGKVYVRRGTNVFAAKPEEVRRLHQGEAV